MSYMMSDAFQRAVYDRLNTDPTLGAITGLKIFDAALPALPGAADELHVTIGEERARDLSSKTSTAARHDFTISVHVFGEGFTRAKQAAGAVVVQYGDTVVLNACATGPPRPGTDFFPLTCDYRERTSAAGKFPNAK